MTDIYLDPILNQTVGGVTISATGLIKLWRTNPLAAPAWVQQ